VLLVIKSILFLQILFLANRIVDGDEDEENKGIHNEIVGHANTKGCKTEVTDNKQHKECC
jgi:hypothetical protein